MEATMQMVIEDLGAAENTYVYVKGSDTKSLVSLKLLTDEQVADLLRAFVTKTCQNARKYNLAEKILA